MVSNKIAALPGSGGVLVQGKRGNIRSHYYLPGGIYPKPMVLVCHGIPGNERLFDFSIALREAGFCTVNFHYSGSWGSDGDFAVSSCFEDCISMMDYIRKNENGWFDLNNVFMLGHSMGGLMAARTGAMQDLVKACVIFAPMDFRLAAEEAMGLRAPEYRAFLENGFHWLTGITWDRFREDAEQHVDQMDLISYAQALADKPVLTLVPLRDQTLPHEDHVDRFNAAIEACGKGQLSVVRYDDDHCCNTHRAEARQAIVDYLKAQVS